MFCPSIYPRSRMPCLNSRQNRPGSVLPMTKAPTTATFGACCADPARGQSEKGVAAAATASMNSRRFIDTSRQHAAQAEPTLARADGMRQGRVAQRARQVFGGRPELF